MQLFYGVKTFDSRSKKAYKDLYNFEASSYINNVKTFDLRCKMVFKDLNHFAASSCFYGVKSFDIGSKMAYSDPYHFEALEMPKTLKQIRIDDAPVGKTGFPCFRKV